MIAILPIWCRCSEHATRGAALNSTLTVFQQPTGRFIWCAASRHGHIYSEETFATMNDARDAVFAVVNDGRLPCQE